MIARCAVQEVLQMPATANKSVKGFKPPIRSLAVGLFLLGCHMGLCGVAGAQATAVKAHDTSIAPQLATFYRNEFEAPVAGKPFSAVEERVTAFRTSDSKLKNRSVTTTRISRDSAGRLRIDRESLAYGDHGIASRRVASYVADPVNHTLLLLDVQSHSALELPWDAPKTSEVRTQTAETVAEASEMQVKAETLGVRWLEGLMADGSLRELSIPVKSKLVPYERAVTVSIETWMSRELNVALWTRSETSSGEISTTCLKDIVRAEPNRELFALPSDYVLTSPGSDTVFAMAR
jgi:hypothetical protein